MLWKLALVIYAIMSLLAFAAHARDKHAARAGTRRTPERTLHTLEFLGGWPGSLIARHLYHHKVRKFHYRLVFWLIGAMHLVVWGVYLAR